LHSFAREMHEGLQYWKFNLSPRGTFNKFSTYTDRANTVNPRPAGPIVVEFVR